MDQQHLQEAIETQFECQRCGHCCKGDGVVHAGREEIERMARQLAIPPAEFIREYAVLQAPGHWWLTDRFVNTPHGREQWCVFLTVDKDGLYGCRVNEAKPDQCGVFPARWRNSDSTRTCAGLRVLCAQLRREEQASTGTEC